MARSTAETIKEITRQHLDERNGLLFGQCVSAVGWIGGTVPDCKNIVEIPMTDVAASGFAVGAALKGRRPIFVMRYQGFIWYNCSSLINYAARSKEVWGISCPVFIRSLAMEGNGIGHTASSSLHSVFMHVPGMPVAAPMTPKEYQQVWDYFMEHDDPIYCSEHRRSFALTEETPNTIHSDSKITVLAISAGRLNAQEALTQLQAQGVNADLFHVVWLKPFQPTNEIVESLKKTKLGLVIDSDFQSVGASESIAHQLMLKSGVPVHALGLEDRVCGASQAGENITPSAQKIEAKITALLKGG
jgi:pyruvate/2-oxoglutarate/acetoin dehydrogenase E1 component